MINGYKSSRWVKPLAQEPGSSGAADVIKRNGARRKAFFCVRMDAWRVYGCLDIDGAGSWSIVDLD
jgi:hypothetical protein